MISIMDGTIARMESVLDPIAKVMHRISAAMLLIMPLPVFVDVVVRLAYAGEVPGKIELEEFILSIVIFFGLAYVQRAGGHIKIDLLTSRFPKWVRRTLDSGIYTISTVLFGLMSSHLFIEGVKKYNNHETSFALDIPVFIFRYLAAFGVAVLTLVVLLELFRSVKQVLEANRGGWLLISIPLGLVLILGPVWGFAPQEIEGATAGYLGMALMFILLFLGMPVGFGMTLAGLLGMIVVYGAAPPALGMLGIATFEKAASYMLTVVPLFILMGQFAYHSGISADLFNTGQVWMGRLPGGLAMSSVAGCAGFAAVCGDSLATAVTMGTVAIPSMKEQKYDMSLATGSLAAGGTLGILIPPSAAFIFYAIVTEESIGQLFIAGIVPGLLLTILFMAIIYIRAWLNPSLAPKGARSTLKEKIISLRGVIGMLALFLLIMGGDSGRPVQPGGRRGRGGCGCFCLCRS